jgi:hypothetical protein
LRHQRLPAAKAEAREGVGRRDARHEADRYRADGDDEAVPEIVCKARLPEQRLVIGEGHPARQVGERQRRQVAVRPDRGQNHPEIGRDGEGDDHQDRDFDRNNAGEAGAALDHAASVRAARRT